MIRKVLITFKKIVQIGFVGVLVVGGGVFGAGKLGYVSPIHPFVVMSGSMEPAVKTGSVVLVQGKEYYQIGDIITFGKGKDSTTTHRVTDFGDVGGELGYVTKGDANEGVDGGVVQKDLVVGKVILHVPYLGFGVDFAKKPYGFILLVIVPATIIVYEELKVIWGEMRRVKRRLLGEDKIEEGARFSSLDSSPGLRMTKAVENGQNYEILNRVQDDRLELEDDMRMRAPMLPVRRVAAPLIVDPAPVKVLENTPKRVVRSNKGDGGISKVFGLVPAIAAVAIFLGISGAYFLDTELSVGNVLGAAEVFGDQVPSQ